MISGARQAPASISAAAEQRRRGWASSRRWCWPPAAGLRGGGRCGLGSGGNAVTGGTWKEGSATGRLSWNNRDLDGAAILGNIGEFVIGRVSETSGRSRVWAVLRARGLRSGWLEAATAGHRGTSPQGRLPQELRGRVRPLAEPEPAEQWGACPGTRAARRHALSVLVRRRQELRWALLSPLGPDRLGVGGL